MCTGLLHPQNVSSNLRRVQNCYSRKERVRIKTPLQVKSFPRCIALHCHWSHPDVTLYSTTRLREHFQTNQRALFSSSRELYGSCPPRFLAVQTEAIRRRRIHIATCILIAVEFRLSIYCSDSYHFNSSTLPGRASVIQQYRSTVL